MTHEQFERWLLNMIKDADAERESYCGNPDQPDIHHDIALGELIAYKNVLVEFKKISTFTS